jgi:hypothetical protein
VRHESTSDERYRKGVTFKAMQIAFRK